MLNSDTSHEHLRKKQYFSPSRGAERHLARVLDETVAEESEGEVSLVLPVVIWSASLWLMSSSTVQADSTMQALIGTAGDFSEAMTDGRWLDDDDDAAASPPAKRKAQGKTREVLREKNSSDEAGDGSDFEPATHRELEQVMADKGKSKGQAKAKAPSTKKAASRTKPAPKAKPAPKPKPATKPKAAAKPTIKLAGSKAKKAQPKKKEVAEPEEEPEEETKPEVEVEVEEEGVPESQSKELAMSQVVETSAPKAKVPFLPAFGGKRKVATTAAPATTTRSAATGRGRFVPPLFKVSVAYFAALPRPPK